MNDLDTFALAVMIPLACYATYKIGYWWGCRRGMLYAIDKLQDAANTLKQIAEELHARQNRQV